MEHCLLLLAQLQLPITVLSRHSSHLQLAQSLNARLAAEPGPEGKGRCPGGLRNPAEAVNASATLAAAEIPGAPIQAIAEPPPWQGPLLALQRLMALHPRQRLLLCPVDMPDLTKEVLGALIAAAATAPQRIHLAHDGQRLQPLLGIYPSSAALRQQLESCLAAGERRLQGWLADQPYQAVALDPRALRNVNRPED